LSEAVNFTAPPPNFLLVKFIRRCLWLAMLVVVLNGLLGKGSMFALLKYRGHIAETKQTQSAP